MTFLVKISAMILAMFMPMITAFNSISVSLPFANDTVAIEYDFSNEESGSAAGEIVVTAPVDGNYQIYWGDENGEKLSVELGNYTAYYSELATVKVDGGKGEYQVQSFTAIPEGAETILVYRCGIFTGEAEIPEEKIADFGEKTYNFGALSDVHFNRYNGSLTGDDSCLTFANALNFIDYFDVELVALSGDLSVHGERDAFEKFNTIASEHDYPVYTCTGNHDVDDEFVLSDWQELINIGVYGEEKAEGVVEVSANGLDFVYAPESIDGDVFVFLSQYAWDYNSPESRILTDDQLDWLEAQLEKYKDTTVYLFFHTFLNNPVEGEVPGMGEGNLVNNKGHQYDLPFTEGCPDEVRFTEMMDEYENVVYFNGHSHWAYDMQELNDNLNIADYNGEYATMVHLSGVGSPRRTTANLADTTEHYMRSSEGMIINVYEDKIVLTGVDFLRGEMLSYATYVIEK